MSLKIRLRRVGRKNQPSYRIVVADSRASREGNVVALLGHYSPRSKGPQYDVDVEKTRAWLAKGATPSETVVTLLKKAGCFAAPAAKEA
ncbi:MAG: 30S ribosomal protein S16 [Gemmatimonadota bacterium]